MPKKQKTDIKAQSVSKKYIIIEETRQALPSIGLEFYENELVLGSFIKLREDRIFEIDMIIKISDTIIKIANSNNVLLLEELKIE